MSRYLRSSLLDLMIAIVLLFLGWYMMSPLRSQNQDDFIFGGLYTFIGFVFSWMSGASLAFWNDRDRRR